MRRELAPSTHGSYARNDPQPPRLSERKRGPRRTLIVTCAIRFSKSVVHQQPFPSEKADADFSLVWKGSQSASGEALPLRGNANIGPSQRDVNAATRRSDRHRNSFTVSDLTDANKPSHRNPRCGDLDCLRVRNPGSRPCSRRIQRFRARGSRGRATRPEAPRGSSYDQAVR